MLSAFSATFAQNVNIPDTDFKAYLVGESAINTNADTEIQVSEAISYNGVINISNLGISDLTGIEEFTNIIGLYCDFNNLTVLDLSANTNLQDLVCNNNSIASMDLTGCAGITQIIAATNNLTGINLSTNTGLQLLNLGVNNLTSLDLTSNVNLTHVYCFSNNLSDLNVANGNNTNIAAFIATGNPNLTCIQVDDVAYSNANWSGGIDASANFSLNCCTINIPDANFKTYLVGNPSINTNADSEIQCSEASGYTGTINCQNLNISDLTGIEAFTSLTVLLCGNNPLATLDVSQNTSLLTLQPHNNNLSSLDVTQNTALTNLVVVNNNLASIDLSQNTNLNIFSCGYNNLTSLDVSQNTNLNVLSCNNNNLTALDVSNNNGLTTFICDTNSLTSLNLKNLTSSTLTSFSATENPNLTCIEVDDVADATANWTNIDPIASFSLNCSSVGIIEKNTLAEIHLYPNPASSYITVEGLKNNENYQILNTLGKVVQQGVASNKLPINIESLPSGMYFIQIKNYVTVRFIKE